MTSFPKISIITANYNGAAFLEATIQSLLRQQYPNLEYIVVDGGSTDHSMDIINQYRSHMAHVICEPDKGMYDAIQKGMQLATGDIMGWLNADDMHHTKSLFTIAEIFTRFPQVQWLMGNPTYFDEEGRTIHCYGIYRICRYDYMIHQGGWIQQESTFWTRALWQKAGGQVSLQYKYAGDFELWSRFFDYAELCITDTLLAGFRYRSKAQLTLEHFDDYVQEVNDIIQKKRATHSTAHFKLYKTLKAINRFLARLKIVNTAFFDLAIRSKMGVNNTVISFDRSTQTYKLSK
jgi:glycosyltransferase involved in cell wall biosynthesis